MPTAINALTGVQWTDLNGSNLSTTDKNNTVALVTNINDHVRTIDALMDRFNVNSASFNNLFATRGFYYSEADARRVVAPYATRPVQNGQPVGACAMYLNEQGEMMFLVMRGTTETKTLVPLGTTIEAMRASTGMTPIIWQNAETAFNTVNIPVLLDVVNRLITPPISATDKLTFNQWQTVLDILKRASFKEASKLAVVDGGGIKTYGGKWYANGQEVSYLDITFAVRVNQLFVINDNVTTHLSQLQKNNTKIKLANQISSIISNLSPTSSSGTVSAQWLAAKILSQAIKVGVIPPPVPQYSGSVTNVLSRVAVNEATLVVFDTAVHGVSAGVPTWVLKHANGSVNVVAYDAEKPLMEFVGKTNVNTNAEITTYNFSAGQGYNLTALLEIMPSSISKLFNTTWGQMVSTTSTLNQTDCTTMTTELKSYTSNLDAENQLLQTQLSQLNDKRSEVLDSMSSLIKGTVSVNNDMARNLGAL